MQVLVLPLKSGVDDSHHVHPIWKRPQQEQGFDDVTSSSSQRNQLEFFRRSKSWISTK
jgi:hypothetical protein